MNEFNDSDPSDEEQDIDPETGEILDHAPDLEEDLNEDTSRSLSPQPCCAPD